MKKEPLLYGLIGLLVGIIATGIVTSYSVNRGNNGMMQMMGVSTDRLYNHNVDKRFIEQMIPHHESAIAMAKLALEKTKHDEIKALSNNIIKSQSAEIITMRQWYKDWYGTEVPTVTTDSMWGGSMMNSRLSTDALVSASDFDEAFLAEMIGHHQMAVMMANMLSSSTNRSEMKKLASDIITAQNKEIADMQTWQYEWGYGTASEGMGGAMHMMGH